MGCKLHRELFTYNDKIVDQCTSYDAWRWKMTWLEFCQIRFKAMIQGKPLYHKYLEELKEKPYKRMGPPKELFQKSKYYQKKWYENESSLNRC